MVQLSLLYLYTGGLYLNKVNLLKIIKLSLGASLAIFNAWLIKLEYSMVAGVIVLLTIKNTKKEHIIIHDCDVLLPKKQYDQALSYIYI